jgi:hypothetical protein
MALRRWAWGAAGLALVVGLLDSSGGAAAAECGAPRAVITTSLGIRFCVDPTFDPVVTAQIQRIRDDIRAQRQAGKLVMYASTPISPRGGGHMETNLAIAASVKRRLEKEYGGTVWVLDPGRYQLPDVNGRPPGGPEYMVVWAAVLAGDDGTGRDFDAAHFTGPGDMRAFFGCGGDDVSGCIERWLTARAGADAKFRSEVADAATRRQAFVRYYALRASSAYSSGAHDEWNIFVRINRGRPVGEQIAVYFDGRPASPPELETEISPGYEFR